MPINYITIHNCCVQKCRELGINFDFNNNNHLQYPNSLDDIYKNLVYHSQNRSQGCAINFFKAADSNQAEMAERVWEIIKNYQFNLSDDFDYINLFLNLKDDENVSRLLSLEKGKDIQYLELAKTCQCVRKYLSRYTSIADFTNDHTFSNNAKSNWNIIRRVANSIYNMSTELVPDFFKEQDCILGREYLIKADIHVKRFFENIYGRKLSDRQVYESLLELYNNADRITKQSIYPYKVDKLIYLIGMELGNPEASRQFANWVVECCN